MPAAGQDVPDAVTLTSEERPVRVAVEPFWQQVEDAGETIREQAVILTADVPITSEFSVRARGAYARASLSPEGTTESVQGLTDVQVEGVYLYRLGESSLVGKLGVSVPVGKEELTSGELSTAIRMTQEAYDLRVTSFGQGLNLSPSLTWARPVGDDLVFGLGASFLYAGEYRPLQNVSDPYQPGNAVELLGGVDVRLTERIAVSGDVTVAYYGTDRQGGIARFDPGNRVSGTVQGLFRDGFTSVRVIGRYQNWGRSDLRAVQANAPTSLDRQQVIPSQGLLRVIVGGRLSETVRVSGSVEGAWYENTLVQDANAVGTVSLAPSWRPTDAVTIGPRAAYTLGGVQGFDASIRTEVRF